MKIILKKKKISKKSYDKKISRNEPCPCGSGKNTNVVVALYKKIE